MKKWILLLIVISVFFHLACKKSNNVASNTLNLISHQWNVVSINGEVFRYVGNSQDYFNFSSSKILYQHFNTNYDTSAFSISSDGKTLLLYPIVNGVQSKTSDNYTINTLTDSTMVLSIQQGINFATDSLKR